MPRAIEWIGYAIVGLGAVAALPLAAWASVALTRRACRKGRHDTGWGAWENGATCIDCGKEAP